MQSLDVISVNIWQMLISLCNLLILYTVLKNFLFAPVKKMLAAREAAINEQYDAADRAQADADANQAAWKAKMAAAKEEADQVISTAVQKAGTRSDEIIAEANAKADGIVRQAEAEADMEKRKAAAEIKKEIIDISSLMTEKMLEREINMKDHRNLIDSIISEIGAGDEGNE